MDLYTHASIHCYQVAAQQYETTYAVELRFNARLHSHMCISSFIATRLRPRSTRPPSIVVE